MTTLRAGELSWECEVSMTEARWLNAEVKTGRRFFVTRRGKVTSCQRDWRHTKTSKCIFIMTERRSVDVDQNGAVSCSRAESIRTCDDASSLTHSVPFHTRTHLAASKQLLRLTRSNHLFLLTVTGPISEYDGRCKTRPEIMAISAALPLEAARLASRFQLLSRSRFRGHIVSK